MPYGDLLSATERATAAAEAVLRAARGRLNDRVAPQGAGDAALLDREQFALHGFAWMATYIEALRQLREWARRLDDAGELGAAEALILEFGFGEYLAQLAGGIGMAPGETVGPAHLGL